jgi:hypothetical protein
MKLTTLVPTALFAVFAGAAIAQDAAEYDAGAHPDFATADANKDGQLSIAELQAALPDVTITDDNADGLVSQAEAEAAISGLAFTSADDAAVVSEQEYDLMVSTLDDDASGDAADDAGVVDDNTDGAEGAGEIQ